MAHLNLVSMGPAVAPLIPCGFDVIPWEGRGRVLSGVMLSVIMGIPMGTVVVIRASVCWMSCTALDSAALVATRLSIVVFFLN